MRSFNADEALRELRSGNQRFVMTGATHLNQTMARRVEVARGQHPFAVVLGCADSRVPPEIVFDQGLGDLFVIRVAGNVVNDAVLGSIEYAVEHLHVQLVMVLGHERCGAVEAAVKGDPAPGHIGSLIQAIRPAVDKVKHHPGDVLSHAIRMNVELVVDQLKSSAPLLAGHVQSGKLKIVGAFYDLDSGKVNVLG